MPIDELGFLDPSAPTTSFLIDATEVAKPRAPLPVADEPGEYQLIQVSKGSFLSCQAVSLGHDNDESDADTPCESALRQFDTDNSIEIQSAFNQP